MNEERCGCCEEQEILTPTTIINRPGLDTLVYRVGTHASFMETMKARLSSSDFPSLANLKARDSRDPSIALLDAWATVADVLTFYQERIANEGYLRTAKECRSVLELASLVYYTPGLGVSASVFLAFDVEDGYNTEIPAGTRVESLPSSDGLPQPFETFEPLAARANLNALKPRTTEQQRITLTPPSTTSPPGTTPPPQPPGTTPPPQPPGGSVAPTDATQIDNLYLKGSATELTAGDGLLFVFGSGQGQQVFRQVQSVEIQPTQERTRIVLQPDSPASSSQGSRLPTQNPDQISEQIQQILQPVSQQPANASQLQRPPSLALDPNFDAIDARIMRTLAPGLSPPEILGNILTNLQGNPPSNQTNSSAQLPKVGVQIYALQAKSAPFGHNAPLRPIYDEGKPGQIKRYEEWLITGKDDPANVPFTSPPDTTPTSSGLPNPVPSPPEPLPPGEQNLLSLDRQYDQIIPGSWVVIKRPNQPQPLICRVTKVEDISQAKYRMTGRVTQLTLEQAWLTSGDMLLTVFRNTTVYAESELLDLGEKPIDGHKQDVSSGANNEQNPLGGPNNENSPGGGDNEQNPTAGSNNGENNPDTPQGSFLNASSQEIELDGLHEGLEPGRWVIVSGECSDVPNINGIMASEAVMLAGVKHGVRQSQTPPSGGGFQNLPGEKPHTFLKLAKPLTYSYKPDTVTIYGNVVKATHGETSTEILGSGDATQEFQQFTLSQSPLTYLPAHTPTGTASTLEVYVNDVPWHEVKSLAQAGPSDRCFVTQTDENGNTTVIFGNGHNGARLPTGVENVRAAYRVGVGKEGNQEAGKINQLVTRPLGVKGVSNPLPSKTGGGTNKESCELVRHNAPLRTISLDRAVSVQDYANFARTNAWIGKASAVLLGDRHRQIIHLTIASVEDVPVDKNSDSYRNFLKALYQFADPHLTIQVDRRELMLLIISAKVRILPYHDWESVSANIRTDLSNTFSFENRELGQDVFLSEVISIIQQVLGVDYVEVDILDSVCETEARNPIILREKLKNLASLGTQSDKKQPQQPKERIIVNLANINPMANGQSRIQPAQIAIFSPQVAGTLILQELKS